MRQLDSFVVAISSGGSLSPTRFPLIPWRRKTVEAEEEFEEQIIKPISIRTSGYLLFGTLKKEDIEGLNIYTCFTDSIPELPPEHSHFVVTITTPGSIELFAKWLYKRIKDKPDAKIMINGNQINIDTISLVQIMQLVRGEREGGQIRRETDCIENC
jgi:hypothetical protein